MGCPFFEPLHPMEPGHWTQYWVHRPRLPLGEAWSGVCHADLGAVETPPEDRQRELCNCGYARGRCENFPASCAADAVRFSVVSESPMQLLFVLEKDYAPLEHGELDLSTADCSSLLSAQARAFVESRLRHSASGLQARSSTSAAS